jgi:hypothetical protein
MSTFPHRLVTSAIVANLPVAVWVECTHDELAEKLDLGLLLFFSVEIAARIISAVKRREWDRWLAVDVAIISLALTPLGLAPIARTARLAHLGRHLNHLRHVTLGRLAHV